MLAEAIALALGALHFGVPVVYYWYAKSRWLRRPWDLRISEEYRPKVSVIIPTYNEAGLIVERLDNIYSQDYPKNLVEVIVVDSDSSDGTPRLVEEWAKSHGDLLLKLLREKSRRGKAFALNQALEHATGEVIMIADADATWPRDAITRTVKWLSDPSVGAVSCLKKPLGSGAGGVEEGYRQYYNVLRIAESKAYSTPIFHGELAAFKTSLLKTIGGFPTDIGADDSHTATRIALMGYRAITPDDIWVEERIPKKKYFSWRIRRAQHLIQHFTKALRVNSMDKRFKRILYAETYLHLVNPWILAVAIVLLVTLAIAYHNLPSLAVLFVGLLLLVLKPYRTWMVSQLFLIAASIRNRFTKELVWEKQDK